MTVDEMPELGHPGVTTGWELACAAPSTDRGFTFHRSPRRVYYRSVSGGPCLARQRFVLPSGWLTLMMPTVTETRGCMTPLDGDPLAWALSIGAAFELANLCHAGGGSPHPLDRHLGQSPLGAPTSDVGKSIPTPDAALRENWSYLGVVTVSLALRP